MSEQIPGAENHAETSTLEHDIEKVRTGQKTVLYAILINLSSVILAAAISPIFGVFRLVGLAMALYGVFTLTTGLNKGTGLKILYIILMFIPLVNLIVLLILSSNATTLLRSHGYKVGLLGASKK